MHAMADPAVMTRNSVNSSGVIDWFGSTTETSKLATRGSTWYFSSPVILVWERH